LYFTYVEKPSSVNVFMLKNRSTNSKKKLRKNNYLEGHIVNGFMPFRLKWEMNLSISSPLLISDIGM
jgi:hypothetical protein